MQLRRWQQQALEVVESLRSRGQDRALIAACPGAGKTRFSATLLADWIAAGVIQCAVVVVPTRTLKGHWKRGLKARGLEAVLDVDNGTLEERRARGMDLFTDKPVHIVTYQQVAAFPELFAAQCSRYRVCAVFDEVHHAADEAEFGQALIVGFEDATFKLSLSGTPFNTKGGNLAFCASRQVIGPMGERLNETITDYPYSYGEALRATGASDDPNVVRAVTFIKWNGYAKWRLFDAVRKEETERVFTGHTKTDPLGPLLDPELDNLKKMLRAALAELEEMRRHHANAAMLITAKDVDHCEDIARLVRGMGVPDVVTVVYDTPGALDVIEAFEAGHQRVLVAVKMISEGVDIKRLRVGVYASDVKTRMFFSQFIGRFLRWDGSLGEWQFASVFIPEHVTLIEYAREIERMVAEAVMANGRGPGEGPGVPSPPRMVLEKTGDGAMHGAIQHGLFYEADITERLHAWMRRAGVNGQISISQADKLYKAWDGPLSPAEAAPECEKPSESRLNDKLVGRIVAVAKGMDRADLTFDKVQALANRAVGIPKKDKLTPQDVLVRRGQFLRELLASLYAGERDGAAS
jgi:superfamily II DNA or RNA helicase